jgi:hypothetical protein
MSSDGSNVTGGNNVYQVNRQAPSNPLAAALTNGQSNGTNRTNAVTHVHAEEVSWVLLRAFLSALPLTCPAARR